MTRRLLPLLVLPLLLPPAVFAQSSSERYAAECRALVGPLPAFSCADGVPVPVTVEGQPVTDPVPQMTCDRPGLLDNGPGSDGQCVPGSRILNLSTDSMQVSVMCRQKVIRPPDSLQFDELDVIAHNPATGATCWFHATGSREAPVEGAAVPSPTEAVDDGFWHAPETTAAAGCGTCHDNDPFMYSPFVGQVWQAVPVAPFGRYFHAGGEFGFDQWPTETFDLRDNTCLGCHRIGMAETCSNLTRLMTGRSPPPGADARALAWPLSHAMPPGAGLTPESWQAIHGASVADVLSCCADPDQQACRRTPLPRALPAGSAP